MFKQAAFVMLLVAGFCTAAVAEKQNVCHLKGNGSYHLINVSTNAVDAHRSHGDALPGEQVPSNGEYQFDENCHQVIVSACPCVFTVETLLQVRITCEDREIVQDNSHGRIIYQIHSPIGDGDYHDAVAFDSDHSCFLRDWDQSLVPLQFHENLTAEESTDCNADLRQAYEDVCSLLP
jgi:hypothetical protein